MENLKIAIIQSSIYWEQVHANLANFEELIWQNQKAIDLIVLPEMFTTGFTMNPQQVAEPVNGHTMQWMKQLASQTKATIMGSYVVKDKGYYYNRMHVVSPTGVWQYYDKNHLFEPAEEEKNYQAGQSRLIIEINGWKIFPLICYDLRFPIWSRLQLRHNDTYEYDLLVYSANWPTPRINAWNTLLSARAIENQSYCIGCNRIGKDKNNNEYSGDSAVYDYMGNVLLHMSDNLGMQMTELNADKLMNFRKQYPFQKNADKFEFKN